MATILSEADLYKIREAYRRGEGVVSIAKRFGVEHAAISAHLIGITRSFLAQDQSWMDRAVCATADPDLWSSTDARDKAAAKQICTTRCPVREECLKYAMDTRIPNGIWGGLTGNQRATLRQRLAKIRKGEAA